MDKGTNRRTEDATKADNVNKERETNMLDQLSDLDLVMINLAKLLSDPPPPSPGLSASSTSRHGMAFAKKKIHTCLGQRRNFPEFKKLWRMVDAAQSFHFLKSEALPSFLKDMVMI